MAGQNAENLLDIGDDDSPSSAPTGLAAGGLADFTPSPAPGAGSANPLDDLLDLFGSAGLSQTPAVPPVSSPVPMMTGPAGGMANLNGFGSPSVPTKPNVTTAAKRADDDLLGLF